jgi:hypothetical protein
MIKIVRMTRMSLRVKTLDERESAEMQQEATNRGWEIARLEFSHHSHDWVGIQRWMKITNGDKACGDAADPNVIIELKTLADSMDYEHLKTQCHKMSWTEKKYFIIVRDVTDSYWRLTKHAKLSPGHVESCVHKYQIMAYKLRCPVFFTFSIKDTFDRMESIFKNHDQLPTPVNTWYMYRGDVEKIDKIRMIAVVHGIGIARARVVPDPGAFMDDARKMELEDFQANYRGLENWGNTTCKRFWEAMQ